MNRRRIPWGAPEFPLPAPVRALRAVASWVLAHLWLRPITAEGGALYLQRYLVLGGFPASATAYAPRTRRPGKRTSHLPWSLYLHKFHRPDFDRAHHSHPWRWAVSVCLSGGYVEERIDTRTGRITHRIVRPGTVTVLRHDTYHVVSRLLSAPYGGHTWTAFLTGPRCAGWGFWIPGRGFVPHHERFEARGLTTPTPTPTPTPEPKEATP